MSFKDNQRLAQLEKEHREKKDKYWSEVARLKDQEALKNYISTTCQIANFADKLGLSGVNSITPQPGDGNCSVESSPTNARR